MRRNNRPIPVLNGPIMSEENRLIGTTNHMRLYQPTWDRLNLPARDSSTTVCTTLRWQKVY